MMNLETERLTLRPWHDSDRPAFAAMSGDPAVMRYLRALPTRAAADAWIDRQIAAGKADGFCFHPVGLKQTGAFIGVVGLLRVPYQANFTPAVEIGWRIASRYWGQGYAPEAARAALDFGFRTLELPEIVANTSTGNMNSQRVMLKLGMVRDLDGDFDHPGIEPGHELRRQVLYRLSRQDWLRQDQS